MSLILSWLTSKLAGPIAAGLAAMLLVVVIIQAGAINGWPVIGGGLRATVAVQKVALADAKADQARFAAAAAKAVADRNTAVRARQAAVASAYQDGLGHAQTITNTIIRKVPVYVSAKSDAACVVPLGAVRLFDAAASGSDPGAVAALVAPGQPDDSPSTVKLSDFVALLAQNFGAARANADQLSALQAAVRAGQ